MIEGLDELLNQLAAHTSLGHAKRNRAFVRQVECLARHPGRTASGSCNDMAAAASAYRFAGNGSVDLAELRKTRLAVALNSCPEHETILAINDVSLLDYFWHDSKSDRRAIGDGKGKGYEYVCNLGIALESGQCLGVLHDCLINAKGPDDVNQIDYHGDELFTSLSERDPSRLECNHKHILKCHFCHIAGNAAGHLVILVADREFDDHFIFESCYGIGQDFVIRSNASRNVQVPVGLDWLPPTEYTKRYAGLPLLPDHLCTTMAALVDNVPLKPFKSIPLDGKGRLTDEKSARSYAAVSVGSFAIKLYRQAKRNKTYFHPRDYVSLNVVVVRETAPPEGREPIQWILYTSLPVNTMEQIHHVVRIYELRWFIECFFKYLKSGFEIEELRYDDARKTAIHLVATTIAAAFLCNLKMKLGLPRCARLPPDDYDRVKQAVGNLNNPAIDPNLRVFALLSKSGGWKGRKNDPISPLTLMRGFRQIVDAFFLFENAPDLIPYLKVLFGKSKKCV